MPPGYSLTIHSCGVPFSSWTENTRVSQKATIAYIDSQKQILDGSKTYHLHLPPTCRLIISGLSRAMTRRHVPNCRLASPSQLWAARAKVSIRTVMIPMMFISHRNPRKARKTIGYKPFPIKTSLPPFACMLRLKPGLTKNVSKLNLTTKEITTQHTDY